MKVIFLSQPGAEASGTGQYTERMAGALGERIPVDRVEFPVDARSPVAFVRAAFDQRIADAAVAHVQFDYVLFGPRGAFIPIFFPLLALIARLRGVRVIVTVHEALNGDHVASPLSNLKRLYIRAMNLIVAACSDHLLFLSEQGRDRFTTSVDAQATSVVPHGVDVCPGPDVDPPAAKRRFGFDPDEVVVVEPGYIDPRKGTDLFLELARRRPDCEFLVAGGPPRERHRAFADSIREDAPDNLTVTGRLSDERYHLAFVAANVAVLPYSETAQTGVVNPVTQSGVFNECAAHRLPVAASECPRFVALNEEWGCPALFDPEVIDSVETCLDRLLAGEERDRVQAGLEAYAEANSLRRAAAAHLHVYEDVASRPADSSET
jgi:glycosyltransferase involved in cell wall biosynthesis